MESCPLFYMCFTPPFQNCTFLGLQAVFSINRLALRACFSLNAWPVAEPERVPRVSGGVGHCHWPSLLPKKEACGELGHFGTPVQHEGWPGSPEGFVHRVRETRVPLTDFFFRTQTVRH